MAWSRWRGAGKCTAPLQPLPPQLPPLPRAIPYSENRWLARTPLRTATHTAVVPWVGSACVPAPAAPTSPSAAVLIRSQCRLGGGGDNNTNDDNGGDNACKRSLLAADHCVVPSSRCWSSGLVNRCCSSPRLYPSLRTPLAAAAGSSGAACSSGALHGAVTATRCTTKEVSNQGSRCDALEVVTMPRTPCSSRRRSNAAVLNVSSISPLQQGAPCRSVPRTCRRRLRVCDGGCHGSDWLGPSHDSYASTVAPGSDNQSTGRHRHVQISPWTDDPGQGRATEASEAVARSWSRERRAGWRIVSRRRMVTRHRAPVAVTVASLVLALLLGPVLCQLVVVERGALVDVYTNTSGSGWVNRTGWTDYANASADPCSNAWFGVTCTSGTPQHVMYVAGWGGVWPGEWSR